MRIQGGQAPNEEFQPYFERFFSSDRSKTSFCLTAADAPRQSQSTESYATAGSFQDSPIPDSIRKSDILDRMKSRNRNGFENRKSTSGRKPGQDSKLDAESGYPVYFVQFVVSIIAGEATLRTYAVYRWLKLQVAYRGKKNQPPCLSASQPLTLLSSAGSLIHRLPLDR